MNKLLALLQILIKQTDENHKLTTILIRKLIECVKILSKTEILVIFKGGYEVRTEIE